MADRSESPPIFSENSLRTATRIVAFYCLFDLIVRIYTLFYKPATDIVQCYNSQEPVYFIAGFHLLILIASVVMISRKQYTWWLTGVFIALIIYLRVDYGRIAEWVCSWS